jgi:aconitate hydratase
MVTPVVAPRESQLVIGGRAYRYLTLAALLGEQELAATPYAVRVLIENVARRAPASLPAVLARLRGERPDCEVPLHPNRIMLHDTTLRPAGCRRAQSRRRLPA